jgi:uncharacterized protein YkwD
MGENIAYGQYADNAGEQIIAQFIIDDGVPTRGHRTNTYSKSWTHAGVACGCHATYGDMCCIQFGKDIIDQGFPPPSLP